MMRTQYDAVVIGAGCAGLAAAAALRKKGIEHVLLLEKDEESGGILNQCIHNGFGLTTFHEQLSGPAFAQRFIDDARSAGVEFRHGAMVTKIGTDRTVTYQSADEGIVTVEAKAVILSVGCYERNRGALSLPGTRPAGVFTAGQAQRYVNIDGWMPGERVFILGSGDIGLIMARRMTLEGAAVLGVAEIMPYSNGLPRNMKQCLEDFDIPLYLSHTVTTIYGEKRLEGIDIAQVDENRNPIQGTEKHFDCDTLLLSVGLIPENHLGEQAGIPMNPATKGPKVDETYMCETEGIFACGNGLHVHDLADFAAHQGTKAGEAAAVYITEGTNPSPYVSVIAGNGISYVVPDRIHTAMREKTAELYFRVRKPMHSVSIVISAGKKVLRTIHQEHVMPSEMEHVLIAGKMIEGISDEIRVEIVEE
ncbi:MAG: NAD(P)/FAD-dependent oxidoreductase [Bulleidia sp.]